MSAITEHISVARAHRPTIGTLRLPLKHAHRSCGFVQGGWWPRSTRLTVELPSLLEALSLRFGPIDRVRFHQSDWSPTPPSIKHQGGNVILDASQDSPNVITVFRERLGRLALLVVPPYTDADDAHGDDNGGQRRRCFPHQLLGISERSVRIATAPSSRCSDGDVQWGCKGESHLWSCPTIATTYASSTLN